MSDWRIDNNSGYIYADFDGDTPIFAELRSRHNNRKDFGELKKRIKARLRKFKEIKWIFRIW